MEWSEWKNLSDKEQEEFRTVINTLINQTFILEKEYNSLRGTMEFNSKYKFLERNSSICEQFLATAGWKLYEDPINGVYFVRNEVMSTSAKFDKVTTTYFLILRLIFEEKRSSASLSKVVKITIQEFLAKGEALQLINGTPNKGEIKNSMKRLKRFMLIDKGSGDYDNNDTVIVIYPSMLHLIGNDVLEGLLKEFQEVSTYTKNLSVDSEDDDFTIEDAEEFKIKREGGQL